jgi:sporulation protein YunB
MFSHAPKLKLKGQIERTKILTIIAIIIVFLVFITLGYFGRGAVNILFNYAEVEVKKFTNIVINRAISKHIAEGVVLDELYDVIKDQNGEIQGVSFNSYLVNKMQNMLVNNINLSLRAIEEGKIELLELPNTISIIYDENKLKKGIIYEIPLGVVTKNLFLANLGPKIPVKIQVVGSVGSNMITVIKPYGINNALIEVSIKIEIEQQILLPLVSRRIKVDTNIPVALKIIPGKVPDYYYQGGIVTKSEPFSLPDKLE